MMSVHAVENAPAGMILFDIKWLKVKICTRNYNKNGWLVMAKLLLPLGTWIHRIVKLSPLIHPDLSNSGGVVQHNLRNTAGERIWRLITENVSYMGAREYFENTSTLPNLTIEKANI